MAGNKELESGLKAMAEDFQLPGGGRKKLARLIAEHLWWFKAAERRGMSWQDMIRALTAAGVTARGEKPLSVGTLSSTVWRKRAEAADEKSKQPPPERRRPVLRLNQPDRKRGAEATHPSADRRRQAEEAASPRAGGRSETHEMLSTSTRRDGSRIQSNVSVALRPL